MAWSSTCRKRQRKLDYCHENWPPKNVDYEPNPAPQAGSCCKQNDLQVQPLRAAILNDSYSDHDESGGDQQIEHHADGTDETQEEPLAGPRGHNVSETTPPAIHLSRTNDVAPESYDADPEATNNYD